MPSCEVRSQFWKGLCSSRCSPLPSLSPQNRAVPVPSSPHRCLWEQSRHHNRAGFFHKVFWPQAWISKFRKVNIHLQPALPPHPNKVSAGQPLLQTQPKPCAPGSRDAAWLLPPPLGRAAGSCQALELCLNPGRVGFSAVNPCRVSCAAACQPRAGGAGKPAQFCCAPCTAGQQEDPHPPMQHTLTTGDSVSWRTSSLTICFARMRWFRI